MSIWKRSPEIPPEQLWVRSHPNFLMFPLTNMVEIMIATDSHNLRNFPEEPSLDNHLCHRLTIRIAWYIPTVGYHLCSLDPYAWYRPVLLTCAAW